MKIRRLLVCLLAMMLVGCSKETDDGVKTTVISKGDTSSYDVIVPIDMNESREYHEQHQNSDEDFKNLGNRLMELSKEYFPTSSYVMGEGKVITYDDLMLLIKRESETNEIGLNPNRNEEIPSGSDNVKIVNPILVSDVIEQDYYKKVDGEYVLAGMSVAVFMDPFQTASTGSTTYTTTLSDDIMFEYGSTMARKLERYLRTKDESKRIPILITLYVKGEIGSYLPGYMLGKAYFVDRSPSFERLNETWALLPSSTAQNLDLENYNQFANFKSALSTFIVDDVGIVGIGYYENQVLQELNITVKYSPKTYVEYMTIVNYCSQLLNNFVNDTFDITVEFENQSETTAIVLKNSGNKDIQIVYLN